MKTDISLQSFVADVFTASAEVKRQAGESITGAVVAAAELIANAYRQGGILYTFGNGGSAADAQHLAGELVGRYSRTRAPLAAFSLSTDPSALTCIANDFSFEEVFSRQVRAAVTARDVVLGITTSGRSTNVILGLEAAREKGARTIVLTGGDGGQVLDRADVAIVAPSGYTPRIQECHVTVLHALSELIEHLVLGMPLPPQQ